MKKDDAILVPLIKAAQKGDREAFGKLIEATQSRLFRFCITLCGDRNLSDDLCQEAYLKAHENLGKLSNPEAFIDWLFQITKNLYLDLVRLKSSKNVSLDDPDSEIQESTSNSDLGEALSIHKILSQFEPEDRMLLLLVDLEERSYKEAADIIGISEDAVRNRISRLRKVFLEKYRSS